METQRLIIRHYAEKDVDDYYEYIQKPEVVRYEPYRPMTRQEAEEKLLSRISSEEFFAVELKATGKMIGNIYFGGRECNAMEIGYVFNDQYGKQGYATEACRALIEDAFCKGIHRIYAECDPQNSNSWRLLERLGFVREGHLRQNVYFWKDDSGRPIWKDTYIYCLLNPQEKSC